MALSVCDTNVDITNRELLEHGTTDFPFACYHDDLEIQDVEWHWHEELEAGIIIKGTVLLSVGTQVRELKEGEGFFINSERLHAVKKNSSGSCMIHSVVFHESLVSGSKDSRIRRLYVDPILNNGGLQSAFLVPDGNWKSKIMADIEAACEEAVKEQDGYELRIRTALSDMIFLLSRHLQEQRVEEGEARKAGRMRIMLRYIHDHLNEPIDVGQIAQSADISRSECLRCFQSSVHMAPNQYVIDLRMTKAAALLRNGEEKIADIARSVGFSDISYFNRCFKKARGCTPGEWRSLTNA